jgi:hypothetical protein
VHKVFLQAAGLVHPRYVRLSRIGGSLLASSDSTALTEEDSLASKEDAVMDTFVDLVDLVDRYIQT